MPDQIGIDLERVQMKLGNFVLQLIGYEQQLAAKDVEIAALKSAQGPTPPAEKADA